MKPKDKITQAQNWRNAQYMEADINKKLIFNLRDMNHIMHKLYEGRGSQKRVLILLGEAGGKLPQRELTRRLGIQPGSVSEILAKLENAELICRSTNGDDRRTTDIALTEAGKAVSREATSIRRQRHEEMFSCLSAEEKESLRCLLEKVNADWQARYAKSAAPRIKYPKKK